MDELEVPDELAGGGIESDQAIRIEVRPGSIPSPEIKCRGTGRTKDQAARFIEPEPRPDIRTADATVGVGRPSFMAGLTGSRNGVEAPDEFSSPDVVGADRTGRDGPWSFS